MLSGDDPDWGRLEQLARPARDSGRLNPADLEAVILAVCEGHFLQVNVLAQLLKRNARGLQQRYLRKLVREGRLELQHKGKPNLPDQAYRTVVL